MDYYRALEVRALAAVEAKTGEWFYRFVCRWYSKTFSTPLQEVYSLTDTEIFTAYFEDRFEGLVMSGEEEDKMKLEEIRADLLETIDEKFERELKEARGAVEDEDSFLRDQELARIAYEAATKKQAETAKSMVSNLGVPRIERPLAEPKLEAPLPTPIPPDIKMKFVDDSEFEKMISIMDALGVEPRK
jgi:hypothetical protein